MGEPRVFTTPGEPFQATVRPPGDKSLAHRALILAAMVDGSCVVSNIPPGADVESTRSATVELGVEYAGGGAASPGIGNWTAPAGPLDCGNSGTTMRLLTGALAGSRIDASLIGDRSLMKRPMNRLVGPLASLGAEIVVSSTGTAPIAVAGARLRGTEVVVPVASAQVRTAVALAALSADGPTRIDSPPGFRDHTESWLAHLGLGRRESATAFVVLPGPVPSFEVTLPGDPSSAAFVWAAAAVLPGARVTTPDVSLNPGRTGFLDILGRMGATITIENEQRVMGDPTGTVTVAGAPLKGVEVSGDLTVRALDELPLLAVVAAAALGRTVVSDAAELRVKESDRVASSVALSRAAGATAEQTPDGFFVDPDRQQREPTQIDAGGDHRVAMAAAVSSLVRRSPVAVTGFDAADVSWPGFGEVLEGLWS